MPSPYNFYRCEPIYHVPSHLTIQQAAQVLLGRKPKDDSLMEILQGDQNPIDDDIKMITLEDY